MNMPICICLRTSYIRWGKIPKWGIWNNKGKIAPDQGILLRTKMFSAEEEKGKKV